LTSLFDTTRIHQVKHYLDVYGYSEAHIDVITNLELNPSAELPYHNSQHLMTVGIHACEAGRYYTSDPLEAKNGLLLLAGLYHDLNHSNGKHNDTINVSRAAAEMVEIMSVIEPTLSNTQINTIAQLIITTEHPSRVEPANLLEKIMRDSDKLQWVEPDFDRWAEGLSEELNYNVTLENTIKFIDEEKIYTGYGRKKLFNAGLVKREW
jgi:hypothetical protein